LEAIERAFDRIGSRVKFGPVRETVERRFNPETGWFDSNVYRTPVAINIANDRRGEYFMVNAMSSVEFHALNMELKSGHLFLYARDSRNGKYRYLCGQDERGWFAAAVPDPVSSVLAAMESLKPDSVKMAQKGLDAKRRNTRNNRAFRRQGEWYFVPVPTMNPSPDLVLRNEPIRRGRGSSHMVAEVYRTGGEDVYVCNRHPDGLTEEEYRKLLESDPHARFWGWSRMRRNMDVFGRGRVTHRDHRPITLSGWHRVMANRETEAWFIETLLFLD
jgi:hypothetical protein